MDKKQDYAKKCFDEVAHNYDEIPFFKHSAKHVVEIIQDKTRMKKLQVLDVACGTGNVLLECAACFPEATFDAVDISEGMLEKAKENALSQNLNNISFHLQDVTKLELDKKYHVITCSYALFFLPEATQVLNKLISMLRPMGMVIFTTFTQDAFAPSSDIILALLRKYGSPTALEYDEDSWTNLKHKKDIERLCTLAYVTDMQIQKKEIHYGMSIDAWWELFNNTGYKGMLMELSDEDYENVKREYYEEMFKHADMDGEVELIADSWFVIAK